MRSSLAPLGEEQPGSSGELLKQFSHVPKVEELSSLSRARDTTGVTNGSIWNIRLEKSSGRS